jgi:CMP-N-acetylneuraminic acid synthetase
MKILGLIPARGGSKGVPGKNIRDLAGKPVIAYSIESALEMKDLFYRILVSTDDTEIAGISKEYGAEVPFLRPSELADDLAPMKGVIKHAIEFIEKQDNVVLDYVCLLQAADPLRKPEDIKNAIELALNNECDSVISVVQVYATHPIIMKKIENGYLESFCIEEKEGTRRQDYKPDAYMRNGAVYVIKRNTVIEKDSIWGEKIIPYIMPEERSLGIDSETDFKVIEQIVIEKHKNK